MFVKTVVYIKQILAGFFKYVSLKHCWLLFDN